MTEDVPSGAGQATAPVTTETSVSTESVTTDTGAMTGDAAPATTDNATWKDSLPEDLKEYKSLEKFKEPGDLLKSYTELEKMINKKTIGIPTAESSEAEWNEYYGKLRPETAEGYNLEGFTEADVEMWGKTFHENGLTETQAKNLYEKYKASLEATHDEMYSAKGFAEQVKNVFGDDEAAYNAVKRDLDDHMTDEQKALFDRLPNELVGLIYSLTDKNIKAYGASEGDALNRPADKQTLSKDQVSDRRTQLRNKIAELDSRPHQAEEKAKLLQELSATYEGGK